MVYAKIPWILYTSYFILGLLVVFNFVNVIHDAVHGTIFKSRWLNGMFVYLFDILGANSFIWRQRHIRFHHNYTNVMGWDTDIEHSNLLRVSPGNPYSKLHRYQHIYLPFIYPFYVLNWLLLRDFKDFFIKKKTVHKLIKIPRMEYFKLFFFKFFFFTFLIIIPKLIFDISWGQLVTAFLFLMMSANFFSLFTLLPPHANTENEFPLPDSNNNLEHGWFMHMLLTTNDIREENLFFRFFMGNFNCHVAHHLFANTHHIFYPEITRLLKSYSIQYDLPYQNLPILETLKKHYLLIKQNRIPVLAIMEESM